MSLKFEKTAEPLFPGTWADRSADMLKGGMTAARLSWLDDSSVGADRKSREGAGFLAHLTVDDHADFHSLRHRFVTALARAGISPKDAQELARQSTITLKID